MAQSEWAEQTVERIAQTIRTVRGERSTQWLADRTAELGHPISRVAISNLEVGRKSGLDVTDLIVLASALNVPPLQLIYPDLVHGPVELLPGKFVSSSSAVQWFDGQKHLPLPDLRDMSREDFSRIRSDVNEWERNASPLQEMRKYLDAKDELKHALRSLDFALQRKEKGYEVGLEARQDLVRSAERRVRALAEGLRKLDLILDEDSTDE
ncbi:hypothetical protein [Rhodococcus sp. 1139]|uniref:hypothetical protein n=1 Tax=Rhodococcus sp. 1139 TaxID=1833762 RepID=UPI0008725CED|nr:hypothetical protein [Rhodococcus sp. 1139]OFE08209.1 hypothetical protein A5N83_13625 [Rhodococcus sp. 1139]